MSAVRIGKLTFRRTSEDFEGFDWNEPNRERHFIKHGIDFPIVAEVDWSKILKAPDTRKRYHPQRSVALAQCPKLGRVLVVVYEKADGIGVIISVRLANHVEEKLFHA